MYTPASLLSTALHPPYHRARAARGEARAPPWAHSRAFSLCPPQPCREPAGSSHDENVGAKGASWCVDAGRLSVRHAHLGASAGLHVTGWDERVVGSQQARGASCLAAEMHHASHVGDARRIGWERYLVQRACCWVEALLPGVYRGTSSIGHGSDENGASLGGNGFEFFLSVFINTNKKSD
jgi:hypothetical protein